MTPVTTARFCRLAALALAGVLAAGSVLAHGGGRGGWRGGGGYYWGGGSYVRVYPSYPYGAYGWGTYGLPALARTLVWAGVTYAVIDGLWYATSANGYVPVAAPVGAVVTELPAHRSSLMVGGLPYVVANGVTYRERPDGSFEVVSVAPASAAAAVAAAATGQRAFVYPRNNQSASQQASDEFDCHRWAVERSGFDPAAAATGLSTSQPAGAADYARAQAACLDARGYTVR